MSINLTWAGDRARSLRSAARDCPASSRGRLRASSILLALAIPAALHGQVMDEGLTIPGRTLAAGVMLTQESWDWYWEGTLRRTNENIGTVQAQSVALVAGYGVTDRLGVMATLPYVSTHASRGTLREMHGVQDVLVEARYGLLSAPVAGRGMMTAVLAGSVGVPVGDYSPDFLPLSIGLGSRRVSGRLALGFLARDGWELNASAAYTWRGNVKLDREAYFTDGSLHLGSEVAMPDVLAYTIGAGYRTGRLHLPVSVASQRTLGGSDIRRQEMPFVSNRMDWVRVDGGVAYTLPAANLTIRFGAGQVLRGRNVGQATTFSSGLFHTVPF
jgi:Putative MetA-pathway of phenol degradation